MIVVAVMRDAGESTLAAEIRYQFVTINKYDVFKDMDDLVFGGIFWQCPECGGKNVSGWFLCFYSAVFDIYYDPVTKLLINPIVHAVHKEAMEGISVPGVAAPKLNHVFYPARTVLANVTYQRNVHRQRPQKIIQMKLKDVADHMLKWRRLEIRDLPWALANGITPCWRGKCTTEWTWQGASKDPASRKWPNPEDCVNLNFVEVYASNMIDARIKQVLNPSGWANRNGPSVNLTAEPNLEQKATWRDIHAVDDTWFYYASCDVFREAFSEAGNPMNTIGTWSTGEIAGKGWNDVTDIAKNGNLIAKWQKKGSSDRSMEPEDLSPFLAAVRQEVYKRNSLVQPRAAVAAAAPVYRPSFRSAIFYDEREWNYDDENGEDWQDDWSWGDVLPGSPEYFYPCRSQ